jgi:Tfp pilus assembly protein PilO
MKSKSLKVPILAVLGAMVVLALVFVVVWSPQTKQMTKERAALTTAQAQLATGRTQIASLRKQQAGLADVQVKLAGLKSAIPDTPVVDQLIDQINGLVVVSGVTLQAFSPTVAAPTAAPAPVAAPVAGGTSAAAPSAAAAPVVAKAQVISMPMTVEGSYVQIIDFVNRLNAAPRLFVVDSIALTAAPHGLTATITARTFYVNAQ